MIQEGDIVQRHDHEKNEWRYWTTIHEGNINNFKRILSGLYRVVRGPLQEVILE